MKNLIGFFAIDFIRAICSVIIIIFHYACHTASSTRIMFTTATTDFGFLAVTAFFAVSGASLYYNYPVIKGLKKFYYKRWKSLFPMFYICFLYFFFKNVIRTHKFYYGPNPCTLFLTVFGLDGYFLYRINNYYIIGEWFFGAVVILYALYPVVLLAMRSSRCIVPIALFLGFILMFKVDFLISTSRNIVTCFASFYFGILSIKYKRHILNNKISLLISFIVFLSLALFRIPNNKAWCVLLLRLLHGFSFFIILFNLGDYIKENRYSGFFNKVSSISFPMFLLQHMIILRVQGIYNPVNLIHYLFMLILSILLTMVFAKVLLFVNSLVPRSRIYKSFESKIIRL